MKRWMIFSLVVLIQLPAPGQKPKPPDVLFKELFYDVQMNGIFSDSKTFVDCVPLREPATILKDYVDAKNNPRLRFSLKRFVEANFRIPAEPVNSFKTEERDVRKHIQALWHQLKRNNDSMVPYSSLLPLPYAYVVPGGRFREIYYWDSYFTMLGLKEDKEYELMESMVKNFAFLIDKHGHIPNGNRSYYLSRSQPPFFSLMVELLGSVKGKGVLAKYMPAVEKEYRYWMRQPKVRASAVRVNNYVVNRYWDELDRPRQESFKEDVQLYNSRYRQQRLQHEFYRHVRAAAASGWDFSSRWSADTFNLESIRTLDVIPVDLNCLLYKTEMMLSRYYTGRNKAIAHQYLEAAKKRKAFINTYCYDSRDGLYYDYDFVKQRRVKIISAATVYPLFLELASQEKASKVAGNIEKYLLKQGGIVTSIFNTKQQWDAPNGWAPLQWMSITGLHHYGQEALADSIAYRWMRLNVAVFERTGKLMEKYNVEDLSVEAGGGEYPTQDGFGWTNGVLLALMNRYQWNIRPR